MLKSEIGLQMAELANIEKIQKSADFWGSKSEENINSHFRKKIERSKWWWGGHMKTNTQSLKDGDDD